MLTKGSCGLQVGEGEGERAKKERADRRHLKPAKGAYLRDITALSLVVRRLSALFAGKARKTLSIIERSLVNGDKLGFQARRAEFAE